MSRVNVEHYNGEPSKLTAFVVRIPDERRQTDGTTTCSVVLGFQGGGEVFGGLSPNP